MPIYEGLVDPLGRVVRRRGAFQVVSKRNDLLELRVPGDDVSMSFVQATAWRQDADIGIGDAAVSASPDPADAEIYHFAVADYYGLSFRLDNDDADAALDGDDEPANEIAGAEGGPETRGWSAWNNVMPPQPYDFHVIGEVHVSSFGIEPVLTLRLPQGTNPTIVQLDLHLRERPGNWPQAFIWKPVRFDQNGATYGRVEIFYEGAVIAEIDVEDVH